MELSKTLKTKSEKLKQFGFQANDVVYISKTYSGLYKLKDDEKIDEIIKSTTIVQDVDQILKVMTEHPEEKYPMNPPKKLFNAYKNMNSKIDLQNHIRAWPEEIMIHTEIFDSTKHSVEVIIDMTLYQKDAVKLSDEFLDQCDRITLISHGVSIPLVSEP